MSNGTTKILLKLQSCMTVSKVFPSLLQFCVMFYISIFNRNAVAQVPACVDLFEIKAQALTSQNDTIISSDEYKSVRDILSFFTTREDFVSLEFIYQINKVREITEIIQKIDNFSAKARDHFQKITLIEYSKIKKTDESNNLGPNQALIKKRNLEVLLSLLNRAHTKRLLTELRTAKNPIDARILIQMIDRYYHQTLGGLNLGSTSRGNYSFNEVLVVAKILQNNLFSILNNNNYIQLYGSLPNGKSSFQSSDVDIHFSDNLSKMFLKKFSDPDSYKYLKDQPSNNPDDIAMQNAFKQAEMNLAKYLNRHQYETADLLTFKAEDPAYMGRFRMGLFGMYNPLILKIYQGRLFLQIYIGFESRPNYLYSGAEFPVKAENFFEIEIR